MRINKIKLYDSLTKTNKEIATNHIKVYVCGPTLYNYCHIGHGRSFVIFDTFKQVLSYTFDKATVIQNTTDIAESITKKAVEEQCSEKDIVTKYRTSYLEDLKRLNIQGIDIYNASDFIPQMIKHIQTMIDNGDAYIKEDGVYFNTSNFNYDLFENRTCEGDNHFALWKYRENGYESPWGTGIPGWHIECTTMSTKILGNSFHIHGGGSDLQYPHHQNEIVQAFSLCGNRCLNKSSSYPAECWMHNGMLHINEEKMSKSKGQCLFIKDIVTDEYTADIFRYMILKSHYRDILNFSDDEWTQCTNNINLIRKFYFKHKLQTRNPCEKTYHMELLQNDFCTSQFIAKLHQEVNSENTDAVLFMTKVLNFYMKPRTTITIHHIEALVQQRNEHKRNKQYEESDRIRRELLENHIILEDNHQETIWYYI